jgi:hypothetical protein
MKSIGWVAMKDGEPVRTITGNGWRQRTNPPHIYPSEARALAMTEALYAAEVFIRG